MKSNIDVTPFLVSRLRERDEAAFELLYSNYSGALYGIIYRTLNHQEIAEETLTDTFLKIWDQIDKYDPSKGTLFTWMYRIARNQALDARRSRNFKAGEKSIELDNVVYNMAADGGSENFIGLDKVLENLEELCRKLLKLNFFLGFSHAEISEKEGMALGSVKTKIRSCLKNVKTQLSDDFE